MIARGRGRCRGRGRGRGHGRGRGRGLVNSILEEIMGIIQSYNPLEAEEREIKRRAAVLQYAETLLQPSEGMIHEALNEAVGYDDHALELLRMAITDNIHGRHPDLLPLALKVTVLVKDYILNYAEETYSE